MGTVQWDPAHAGCTVAHQKSAVARRYGGTNPPPCCNPHLPASTAQPGSAHGRPLKHPNHTISTTDGLRPEILHPTIPDVLGRGGLPQLTSRPPLRGSPEMQGHVSLCPSLLSMKITSNFVFIHQRRKPPCPPSPALSRQGCAIKLFFFRRVFTVSKGLREQEVAHSVIHLDSELLDTDLNG